VNRLYLTGFMGTGKSAVGPRAATALGYDFIDLDHQIELSAGKPIRLIFEEDGEAVFRDLESATLASAAKQNNVVISTGGGCVVREENRNIMAQSGHMVCLTASAACIVRRTGKGRGKRPLLTGAEDQLAHVAAMLAERDPFYQQCHHIVDTTGRTVEDVSVQVVRLHQEGTWKP
jgi:shikimate kinase